MEIDNCLKMVYNINNNGGGYMKEENMIGGSDVGVIEQILII